MRIQLKPTQIIAGLVVGVLLAGGGYALAAIHVSHGVLTACVNPRTRVMTMPRGHRCRRGQFARNWNAVGPTGRRGRDGRTGRAGAAATVSVGSVTTGPTAAVTNSGTPSNATLNFTLPVSTAGNVTAYGQVWPGASGTNSPNPRLVNTNGNVVSTTGVDAGEYLVNVKGCGASGLQEPIIEASADSDPSDPDRNEAPVLAEAESWQPVTSGPLAGDLSILIRTVDSTSGAVIDSDFSFMVIC